MSATMPKICRHPDGTDNCDCGGLTGEVCRWVKIISDEQADWDRREKVEYLTAERIRLKRRIGELEEQLRAAQPAPIAGLEPVAWRAPTDIPSIELGSSREFILAVYRKRGGKVYSFAAEYLNGYPLRYEYGCPKEKDGVCDGCGDGCPTTGWYYVEGADDDGYTYHALSLHDGDEIKGWRELPQWGEDQFTRSQLEAHAAEQVRPLVEALEGLIEAVRRDSDEGGKGISGYTGARLTDAKNAIRARGQV